MFKSVATGWHLFRLKCAKFDFSWGSIPDPYWGAYSAPQGPLAGLEGPTSEGMKERQRKGG